MPYLPPEPSRYSQNSRVVPAELKVSGFQPRASREPSRSKNPFLQRLSPRTFTVPVDTIFQQLFAEDMKIDPITGICENLRSHATPPAQPMPASNTNEVFARLFGLR
jgi:hypothetical protein